MWNTVTAHKKCTDLNEKWQSLEVDIIVGDLYDFFCDDLPVEDELAGQIDPSMDTFLH